MKLPLAIAVKINTMMVEGSAMPASSLKSPLVQKMADDGVMLKLQSGRLRASYRINDMAGMKAYLANNFGISNLEEYIRILSSQTLTRGEAIEIAGDSKIRPVRTFQGFLVNSYESVECKLNNQTFVVQPAAGSFVFISDFRNFLPHPSVTIVGIENPENFRYLAEQQYLFNQLQPLFVSRYPYSSDLVTWLQSIPNNYLHFGDLDFAGLDIFRWEYQRYLGDKATFFIPDNLENLLQTFGNRELYNKQSAHLLPVEASAFISGGEQFSVSPQWIENAQKLIALFHKYKKVLEQEIFIRR